MTGDGKKLEPKLGLDMGFGEALERFIQTEPREVGDSIERSKKQKPPGDKPPGGLERKLRSEPVKGRRRKPSTGA
jgi:hypothetical protein